MGRLKDGNVELCGLIVVIEKFLFSFFLGGNKAVEVKENLKKILAKFLALC